MNTPTHDEIALQAEQLWRKRGCPGGRDEEIWFEAERQLSKDSPPEAGRKADSFTNRAKAETAAESVVEYQISPAVSEQEAINAALQKQAARAPQVPHHLGPKAKPPESGKPLWDKPHSS
jgi:hypothetical protein